MQDLNKTDHQEKSYAQGKREHSMLLRKWILSKLLQRLIADILYVVTCYSVWNYFYIIL